MDISSEAIRNQRFQASPVALMPSTLGSLLQKRAEFVPACDSFSWPEATSCGVESDMHGLLMQRLTKPQTYDHVCRGEGYQR